MHGKKKVLAAARKLALWMVGHNNYELYMGGLEVAVSSCGGLKTTVVSVNAWYAAVGALPRSDPYHQLLYSVVQDKKLSFGTKSIPLILVTFMLE